MGNMKLLARIIVLIIPHLSTLQHASIIEANSSNELFSIFYTLPLRIISLLLMKT